MSGIAVVVPIGSDVRHLDAQIDALVPQVRGHEVVLSCNGIEPAAAAAQVDRLRDAGAVASALDSSAVRGPSHARNVGWRAVTADRILFCDADDVVGPTWVAALAAALDEHGIVGGSLRFDGINDDALASTQGGTTTGLAAKFGYLPFAPSCNLGVRRDLMEMLDGFDETLPTAEDTDLCWRAAQAGHPIAFAPDASVSYRLRADVRSTFRQARTYARDDLRLLALHRDAGARWTPRDDARVLLSAAKAVLLAPAGRTQRLRAAERLGRVAGRVDAMRRGATGH